MPNIEIIETPLFPLDKTALSTIANLKEELQRAQVQLEAVEKELRECDEFFALLNERTRCRVDSGKHHSIRHILLSRMRAVVGDRWFSWLEGKLRESAVRKGERELVGAAPPIENNISIFHLSGTELPTSSIRSIEEVIKLMGYKVLDFEQADSTTVPGLVNASMTLASETGLLRHEQFKEVLQTTLPDGCTLKLKVSYKPERNYMEKLHELPSYGR